MLQGFPCSQPVLRFVMPRGENGELRMAFICPLNATDLGSRGEKVGIADR